MYKIVLMALLCLLALAAPVQAADQITYVSQPDEVYIFLNDVAFVRDSITIPAGVDVRVALPSSAFENTLTLSEDGQRVSSYRMRRQDSGVMLEWATGVGVGAREVKLEYLMTGLNWTPRYDMTLNGDPATSADFNFFAELTNTALELDGVKAHLIAGRVDLSQPVDARSSVTMNQYMAGYEEAGKPSGEVGAATVQYIYEPGELTLQPGETLYQGLLMATLPARRVLLWNAQTDQQVTVIYKLKNESDLPLAEGIVRSYQNGIFIGSDPVETTPVGSEGSITVGRLQDVRVNRSESQISLAGVFYNYRHEVELTLENFGAQAVTLDVVDRQNPQAEDLKFSAEPARETGNLLRWTVTLAPGEKQTIRYEYQTR